MKLAAKFCLVAVLFKAVLATDQCSEYDLQAVVEIEGLPYSKLQLCPNGYIKFGDPQILTEPDDLLRDLSGAVFAPLIHDTINLNVSHYQKLPGQENFDLAVDSFNYFAGSNPPDFEYDWILAVTWLARLPFAPYSNYINYGLQIAQDSNFGGLGQSRLRVVFLYEQINYIFSNRGPSRQIPRAGVSGPNFAPFELYGSGTSNFKSILGANELDAPYRVTRGRWYFVIDPNDPDSALFNTTTPPTTSSTTTTPPTTTSTSTTTSTTPTTPTTTTT
ncbi:uncharacterized protein LOC142342043 [Convolutriloba macropyga]|uniref:uncharacterized protein LOC142342043 n=1 Tax=Convolutriloba macropyga TaxID=536237 RepID=UPI003F5230F1